MPDTSDNFPLDALPGAEDPPPVPEGKKPRGSESKRKRRTKAAGDGDGRLGADEGLGLLRERFDLRRQDDGTAYLVDTATGLCHDLNAGAQHIGRVIGAYIHERRGTVLKASVKADLVEHLAAEAFASGKPGELHLRSGPHAGGVVVDLGEPDSARAVEITPAGWRIVDRSPIHMRRTRRTGTLPAPERGGSIDEFLALLGWPESAALDFRRLVAWTLSALLRPGDVPVLLFRGGMGTGKSRAAWMVLRLIDPAPGADDGLMSPPRDEEQLVVSAGSSWVACWDNISRIPEWLSDALCRLVTGGVLVRRRLYSDGDIATIGLRRACVLTSIGTDALRGDLAQRLVLVEPPPIRESKAEDALVEEFLSARPRLLGAFYDLAAAVLAEMARSKPPKLHRLGAYSRLCFALDVVKGWDTYADLTENPSEMMGEALEGDAVARAIVAHIVPEGDFPLFEGTVEELFNRLAMHRPEHDKRWPESVTALGNRLRRLVEPLKQQRIEMTFLKTNPKRSVRIERHPAPSAE